MLVGLVLTWRRSAYWPAVRLMVVAFGMAFTWLVKSAVEFARGRRVVEIARSLRLSAVMRLEYSSGCHDAGLYV